MSGDRNLEKRYRRVLRLLPGYYRETWEEDMVAAFLDTWLTGDQETDEAVQKFCRPSWPERASVARLAARLYLGGTGAPRRYFAWGQAVRGAVLAVLLIHAVRGLEPLLFLAATPYRVTPAPPAAILTYSPGGMWPPTVWYLLGCAWIVVFGAMILGQYRAARIIAVLAMLADLVWLTHWQLTGGLQSPYGSWAFWFLLDLAPVLAMAAFHRDAPPPARRPWLLALAAVTILGGATLLAGPAGHPAWQPDFPGLCCILVILACLAHAPRAWSGRAGSGVWSLTLVLLAAVAGAYRIVSLGNYLQDPRLTYYLQGPHLVYVGLAELLILVIAAALVAPDAARGQRALPAQPLRPHRG